jgi:transcriptional regulator with XRE-family HTH domain
MQVSTVHFSGRRMRKARLRKDWSQADLARATGLPEGSLGRWERGEHDPQGAAVVLIARATGRDIEFFYVEGAADDDEEAAAEYRRGLRIGRKPDTVQSYELWNNGGSRLTTTAGLCVVVREWFDWVERQAA